MQIHSRLGYAAEGRRGIHVDTFSNSFHVTSYAGAKALLANRNAHLPEATPRMPSGQGLPRAVLDRGRQIRRLWMWGCAQSDHQRLREAAAAAFAPAAVARLRESIGANATALLTTIAGGDQADLVGQFARPLVEAVILDRFGIPQERRFALFHQLENVRYFFNEVGATTPLQHYFALAAVAETVSSAWQGALPESAIASQSLRTTVEQGSLSADEAIAQATVIMIGALSTIDTLSGAMARLSERPDIWAAMRTRAISVDAVVEESLRLGPPIDVKLHRVAVENISLCDVIIPAGSQIVILLNDANRDPAVFENPDAFNPARDGPKPIAFGAGVHTCLGTHLARSIMKIGLETLLRQFSEWPQTMGVRFGVGITGGPIVTQFGIQLRAPANADA